MLVRRATMAEHQVKQASLRQEVNLSRALARPMQIAHLPVVRQAKMSAEPSFL
jgi:hypothetical protein